MTREVKLAEEIKARLLKMGKGDSFFTPEIVITQEKYAGTGRELIEELNRIGVKTKKSYSIIAYL